MNRVNSHKHRGMEWALIKMSDDLDYADDLYLLSQKRADMQTEIDDLKKDAEYTELKINTRNTKEINLGAKNESINLSTSGASCQLDGNTRQDNTTRQESQSLSSLCLASPHMAVWQSRKLTRRVKLKTVLDARRGK